MHWIRTEVVDVSRGGGPLWRWRCSCGTSAEWFWFRSTARRRGIRHVLRSRRGKICV